MKSETAVVSGHREERSLENHKVAQHPGMEIAFYGDELFLIIGVGKRWRAGGLDLVPFAIDFGERVNVVGKRIAVGDPDLLANAKGADLGGVLATLVPFPARLGKLKARRDSAFRESSGRSKFLGERVQ